MEKIITDSVAELDELFPDRPHFMNLVDVIHPEMARYAEMHKSSRIKQIPWEDIYKLIQNKETTDELYKKVQNTIVQFNS